MSILFIVSVSLLLVFCVALIVLILMQNKRASGLGKAMGGMGANQQTFWDKNKGRSLEGTLERYTKILGAAIMIISLLLNLQFFL